MKYLIVSDIHGSSDSADRIINIFEEEKCDYILLLGDILYHGPRNDLPEFYNPKKVIEKLNPYSDKIIAIKGNCEAEVDQMILTFIIHDFYDDTINNITTHLEHGHHLDLYKGDAKLVLSGHTHIPHNMNLNGVRFINPGSITIPKNNTPRSYGIWDGNKITLFSIDKDIISSFEY